MTDQAVKAQVSAVRELRKSIGRYAERMRDAIATAGREMRVYEVRTRQAVEERRQQLNRATHDLQRATDALARCERDCSGPQRAVAEAKRRRDEAAQALDRARKAAQSIASASSDLAKSLRATESIVGQQASAVSSLLATLDHQLSEITDDRFWHGVQKTAATIGIVAESAVAAMNVGVNVGNVSQSSFVPADATSITDVQQRSTEEAQQNWADSDLVQRERRAGKPQERNT